MQSSKNQYKIMLTGPSESGKSSIINSLLGLQFKSQHNPTNAIQYFSKILNIENKQMRIQILDTSNQQNYQVLKKSSYKGCHIIIFVFDITSHNSFNKIEEQIQEILLKQYCAYDCAAILVGNKKDLFSKDQGTKLNQDIQMLGNIIGQYMEVSAKTGQGILKLFQQAVKIRFRFDQNDQNVRSMYEKVMENIDNPPLASFRQKFFNIKKQQIFEPLSLAAAGKLHQQQIAKRKKDQNLLRILFIGQAQVGKSAIFFNYSQKTFIQNYMPTIGIDFKITTYQNNDITYKIQLWDTAGINKFQPIVNMYYKNKQIVYIVYDITKRQTFIKSQLFIQRLFIQNKQTQKYVCLVGNKIDLPDRVVLTEQGMQLALKYNINFIEISAKNYQQVDLMIRNGIKYVLQHKQ